MSKRNVSASLFDGEQKWGTNKKQNEKCLANEKCLMEEKRFSC